MRIEKNKNIYNTSIHLADNMYNEISLLYINTLKEQKENQ